MSQGPSLGAEAIMLKEADAILISRVSPMGPPSGPFHYSHSRGMSPFLQYLENNNPTPPEAKMAITTGENNPRL